MIPLGKKYAAWKAVMMGLRNSVRYSLTKPTRKALRETQNSYLLDEEELTLYVFDRGKNYSHLTQIQVKIVEYLVSKVRSPRHTTMERVKQLQDKVLLTDSQLGSIITWWARQ